MLSWYVAAAFGGNLYVNNTIVDPRSVAGVALERVTVRFDAQGNILIEAPGYKIEVQGGAPPPPLTQVTAPAPRPVAPPPAGSGVTPARWWLATEDSGSTGHTVEVWINGSLAVTVRSGGQGPLDVGRWLHVGSNTISMKSVSTNPTGGSFYVYVGPGTDQSGTVAMDPPPVQFGLGSTRSGPFEREYTLQVDR